MKLRTIFHGLVAVQTLLAVAFSVAFADLLKASELVELVDPFVGTVTYPESDLRGQENIHGFGKTFPGATTPFGLVQLSPDTVTGGDNGPGYSYTHKTIEGFSFTHMSGIGTSTICRRLRHLTISSNRKD